MKHFFVARLLSWAILVLVVVSEQSKIISKPESLAHFGQQLCGDDDESSLSLANQRRALPYAFVSRSFDGGTKIVELRGGADDDESDAGEEVENDVDVDEDDDDDEEGSDPESDGADEVKGELDFSAVIEKAGSVTQSTIIPYTKKTLIILMKATKKVAITTTKAIQRAIQAGLHGDDEAEEHNDDDEPVPMVQRVLATLQRMVKAALTFPEGEAEEISGDSDGDNEEEDEEEEEEGGESAESEAEEEKEKKDESTTKSPPKAKKLSDFGSFLASTYVTKDERTSESGAPVIGGSLATALLEARAQARLLVIFLPAEKPNKKGLESKEAIAIESMLSEEVGEAANQRARSKGEDTGSFLFWGAKVGSSEAATAMKRLKVKPKVSKGTKLPTLMVIYPAMVIDSSTGQSKVVPKVLAQHHCSPPPSSSVMASWLETLRKRHAKQYTAMQTVLKELQYFKERKEGYTESKKSDKERGKREKEEEEKRLAAEKAEQERLKEIETRRKELKEALSEEPKGNDTKKVALRFPDGRSGQRRFTSEQLLTDVFNWVDAMYEIEREIVILTTMNGKRTFEWQEHGQSLEEAGLGKSTGFRVTIKETSEETDDESTDP